MFIYFDIYFIGAYIKQRIQFRKRSIENAAFKSSYDKKKFKAPPSVKENMFIDILYIFSLIYVWLFIL